MTSLSEMSTGQLVMIAAWLGFAALMLPAVIFGYQGRLQRGLLHAAIWVGVFVAFIVGYSFRGELHGIWSRVAAEIVPAGQGVAVSAPDGERAVRIRRSSSGPFVARATVNGTEMSMLVDTGASSVVLKSADAERAGIDLRSLRYTIAVDTANGSTFCAPVRLTVSVGGIAFPGVEALVAQPGNLKESLLGMTFLKRLRSYDFSGEFLTLRS
jgi:aspartyl protease family protein